MLCTFQYCALEAQRRDFDILKMMCQNLSSGAITFFTMFAELEVIFVEIAIPLNEGIFFNKFF